VVVTGIDPSMGEELRKLGMKAKPLLEKAAKDKDVEVVYRAEPLLQMLNGDGGIGPPAQ